MCGKIFLAVSLLVSVACAAQTNDAGLNKAIHNYIEALKAGDVSAIIAMYERDAFPHVKKKINKERGEIFSRLTKNFLRKSLREDFELRGDITSCQLYQVELFERVAFVTLKLKWELGSETEESEWFVFRRGKWRLTYNAAHLENPDPSVWAEYGRLLEAVSDCTPPTEKEKRRIIELTRQVIIGLREKGCSAVSDYLVPFSDIAYTNGWPFKINQPSDCEYSWLFFLRFSRFNCKDKKEWEKITSAEWRCGLQLFPEMPGHIFPSQARGQAFLQISVAEPAQPPSVSYKMTVIEHTGELPHTELKEFSSIDNTAKANDSGVKATCPQKPSEETKSERIKNGQQREIITQVPKEYVPPLLVQWVRTPYGWKLWNIGRHVEP